MKLNLAALLVLGLILSSEAKRGGKGGGGRGGGGKGPGGKGPGGKGGKGKMLGPCKDAGGPLEGFTCADGEKARPAPGKTCAQLIAGQTDLKPATKENPCKDATSDNTSFEKSGAYVCTSNKAVVDPYDAATDCKDWKITGTCEQKTGKGGQEFWKVVKTSIKCESP